MMIQTVHATPSMTYLSPDALQISGKLGKSASLASSKDPVIKSVVQALQTLLGQGEQVVHGARQGATRQHMMLTLCMLQ
jgi:hypothetical protein